MFCHITENWRGRPLVSREVVVNLIGHTTTQSGLAIRSELDENSYPTGQPVTAEQMESLSLKRDKFHGDWNTVLRRERPRNNNVILARRLSNCRSELPSVSVFAFPPKTSRGVSDRHRSS